jgi:hypothetical protein
LVTDDSQIDRMKLMTLKLKKKWRPVLTSFPEELVDLARTVAQEYRDMEDGYHAQLHAFLGRANHVYRLFQQVPGAYEELKQDPFWENSHQKPKGLTTSKWVLLFIMQAKTPNDRTRASTYAKILDGFARKKVRADLVPERIKKLGGVEAAYDHFLAEERGLQTDETEGQRPLALRKVGLRAVRGGNGDKVQGDVETESPSENSRGAAFDGRRHMPSLDPKRHLIVELEPEELEEIRTAGTARGDPVTFQLKITVHRDAKGFVHVVGELEPPDLPEDFLSLD